MPLCIYYGTKIVNNNENVFSKNIIKLISDEKISIKNSIVDIYTEKCRTPTKK